MWDQYGEKHTGVCLLFEQRALEENVIGSLLDQGLAPPYHKRIRYTSRGPTEALMRFPPLTRTDPHAVSRYVEEHNDDLFFLKTRDWESEFEYRFVVTAPGEDYVYVDYGHALEAVIVGERFPRWQRPRAIAICQVADADAARISWRTGAPRPVLLVATADDHEDLRTELVSAYAERAARARE
jgi:Protein of unknown function (DUF2971)